MAYRKKSGRKLKPSDVLPIWSTTNTEVNNAFVSSCMFGMGITDIPSYWRKLKAVIVFCIFLGACIGLSVSGFNGLMVGSLLGFAAPAGVIWLAVTLFHITVYLLAFCLVWVAILGVLWWLLHS